MKKTGCYFCLKRRMGAVSLLICLAVSGISFLLLISLQSAQLRLHELNLIRATHAVAETNLAAFDQELLDLYGLWGVRSDLLHTNSFYALLPSWQQRAEIQLYGDSETLQPETLKLQIIRYMQVRAPVQILSDYLLGIQGIFSGTRLESDAYTPAASTNRIQPMQAVSAGFSSGMNREWPEFSEIQTYLQENILCHTPLSLTTQALYGSIEWILSPLLEPLQGVITQTINRAITDMMQQRLAVHPEDFASPGMLEIPALYQPDQLADMALLAEKLLMPVSGDLWQRFLLAEYSLKSFVSEVPSVEKNGERVSMMTPGGLTHDAMTERQGELEKIVTGQDDLIKARQRIKGNLVMVRTVLRMLEIITDPDKIQSYRPAANLLVTLIASVSTGTVMLDPEWVVWLLAAADASRLAMLDYDDLMTGRSVELWQQEDKGVLPMYYHDYLRLFLLLQPEATLLERVAVQIRTVLPGPFFCAVTAWSSWEKTYYRYRFAYPLMEQNP